MSKKSCAHCQWSGAPCEAKTIRSRKVPLDACVHYTKRHILTKMHLYWLKFMLRDHECEHNELRAAALRAVLRREGYEQGTVFIRQGI